MGDSSATVLAATITWLLKGEYKLVCFDLNLKCYIKTLFHLLDRWDINHRFIDFCHCSIHNDGLLL